MHTAIALRCACSPDNRAPPDVHWSRNDLGVRCAVDLRIDRAAASVHVVVRARDQRLARRRAAVGNDAVLLRQGRDHLGRQPVEDGEQIGLDPSIDQPVDPLEGREEEDDLLEHLAVQAPVGAEQRMSQAVRDRLAVEVVTEVVDVAASRLDLLVVLLGDVPGQHVHHAAVLREDRGDLLGEEEVRAIDQRQPAGQGVVVRERHQRHAARLAQLVLSRRSGVALGAAKNAAVPFVVSRGSGRMDVQIAACCHEPWGARGVTTLSRISGLSSPAGSGQRTTCDKDRFVAWLEGSR